MMINAFNKLENFRDEIIFNKTFFKIKSLSFTNLCQRPFRAAQTLFYQTIEHHSLIFHLSVLKNKGESFALYPKNLLY